MSINQKSNPATLAKVLLVLTVLFIGFASPVFAGTKVVVVPMAGDVKTIPATSRIVVDTPQRGNYRTTIDAEGVVDVTTGLEWSKRRSFLLTWQEAREYCSELALDARGKIWRLPEINELITLYRFGAAPYIESSLFLDSEKSFWSNTIAARNIVPGDPSPDSRWIAWFTDIRPRGLIEAEFAGESLGFEHYARCVTDAV